MRGLAYNLLFSYWIKQFSLSLLGKFSEKAGFPRKVQATLCTHLQIALAPESTAKRGRMENNSNQYLYLKSNCRSYPKRYHVGMMLE